MVNIKVIEIKNALELDNSVFVDVRSPKEFESSNVPNSVNIPLLTNEERHIIGLLYKQKGAEVAIEKGYEIFNPKIEEFVSKFEQFKDKEIVVYCSRGGMRSKVVVELLTKNGFNCSQLNGGYKVYRNYVLKQFQSYKLNFKLIVLHGRTGSGKTEILQKTSLPVIDLEGIAMHRGSLYGGVGLKPRIQKMFENVLFNKLEKFNKSKTKFVVIEGESRKVGDCIIPEFLFEAMKQGTHLNVECTLQTRVNRIVTEYFDSENKIEQIKSIVPKFSQMLSKKIVQELLDMLNNKEYEKFTKYFLVNYYDKKYAHTLESIKYDYTINTDNIENALTNLEKYLTK